MNFFQNKETRDRFLAELADEYQTPTELVAAFERVIDLAAKEFHGYPISSHVCEDMGAYCTEALEKAVPRVSGHIRMTVVRAHRGADVVPVARTEFGQRLLEKVAAIVANERPRADPR
jgi:hypothetical protein